LGQCQHAQANNAEAGLEATPHQTYRQRSTLSFFSRNGVSQYEINELLKRKLLHDNAI